MKICVSSSELWKLIKGGVDKIEVDPLSIDSNRHGRLEVFLLDKMIGGMHVLCEGSFSFKFSLSCSRRFQDHIKSLETQPIVLETVEISEGNEILRVESVLRFS